MRRTYRGDASSKLMGYMAYTLEMLQIVYSDKWPHHPLTIEEAVEKNLIEHLSRDFKKLASPYLHGGEA